MFFFVIGSWWAFALGVLRRGTTRLRQLHPVSPRRSRELPGSLGSSASVRTEFIHYEHAADSQGESAVRLEVV
jgi:hypothetical protein